MIFETRPFQTAAENALRQAVATGIRRVLLVSPTGSGKTVMLTNVTRGAVAKRTPVLVVAHRKELIDQTSRKLDAAGIGHGVIMAKHPRCRPEELVQVASVQTLAKRMDKLPPAGLLIIDEAHHARAETYQKLIDHYAHAPIIGATATPWRNDGKGLKKLFDQVVVAARVHELIAQGYLVPFDGFGYENPALEDVKTTAGDYDELELAERMNTATLVGGIVEEWLAHSSGRRTVAFSVNVAHSKSIVAAFLAAGVAAEHLDGKTLTPEREGILARLASGETLVVSNCAVLTEGWDCPSAETAILARPTKSLVIYLQQAGRVLRPSLETGKAAARIHDHAGCMVHHGLPDEDRDYSLDADTKKRDAADSTIRQCPKCLRICGTLDFKCPACGFVFETPEARAAKEQEIEYIRATQLTVDEIRKIRGASLEEKAAEYKRLLFIERIKGFKSGWASHEYRRTYSVWPRFSAALLDQVRAAPSPPIPLSRLRLLHEANA